MLVPRPFDSPKPQSNVESERRYTSYTSVVGIGLNSIPSNALKTFPELKGNLNNGDLERAMIYRLSGKTRKK